MADWNLKSTWEQAYKAYQGRPDLPRFGETLSYLDGRIYARCLNWDGTGGLAFHQNRIKGFNRFISTNDDILVVGCGFGWLVEVLVNLGYTNTWGTEISTVIQSRLTDSAYGVPTEIQNKVLDIDVTDPTAKDQFKAIGAGDNKGEFDFIITEHILEDWSYSDIPNLLDSLDNLMSNNPEGAPIHLLVTLDRVTPSQVDDEIIPNQYTLDEWEAIRPSHYWVDEAIGEYRGGQ